MLCMYTYIFVLGMQIAIYYYIKKLSICFAFYHTYYIHIYHIILYYNIITYLTFNILIVNINIHIIMIYKYILIYVQSNICIFNEPFVKLSWLFP